MSLVAGVIFVSLRGVLALIPPLALRWDSKKMAALGAIAAMGFYLLISGGDIPAQRSFVMGTCLMVAILLDRSALSLRALMVAAAVVLAFQPESLIGPSFQMSFAAVIALVAAYEGISPRLSLWRAGALKQNGAPLRWWEPTGRAVAVYLLALFLSSLIATIATAPYAAYHFHRFTPYGLISNMIAVPVASVLVMPGLVAAVLFLPFGLEAWPLMPVRWGLSIIEWVATELSRWPGASLSIPPMNTNDLLLLTLGGLWLCLWRQRWRWGGLTLFALGCLLPWWHSPPLLIIDESGALMAIHDGRGLVSSPTNKSRFAARSWEETWGAGELDWPSFGEALSPQDGILRCDSIGCTYQGTWGLLAISQAPRALFEDCQRAGRVINLTSVRMNECRSKRLFDFSDLRRKGTHVVRLSSSGDLIASSVADWQGQRPWSAFHSQKRQKSTTFPPSERMDD